MPVRDEILFATPPEPRRLEARFESLEVFSREYACNISRGGVFLETDAVFELRELVVVALVLVFRDETVALDGEVVSVRPGGIPGAPAGVAVQLLAPASELRARLGPLAEVDGPVDAAIPGDARAVRRTATRARARVGADGSTRTLDLSPRGAMIATQGELPQVGETIEVSLEHPVSGEQLTIESTVIHHGESHGERGMGVRFDTHVVEQPGVERFVEDVQAAAHARSLGGIRGPIDPLGLASLLQMFGASAPRGTLCVACDDRKGSIAFDAGVLRHARTGELSGSKALSRLLGWRRGSFEFHAEIAPDAPEDAPLPLDGAIFEAVHQVDELARVALPSSVLEAPVRLDRTRLDGGTETLDKVEEAVVDLVAAGFPLARVVDVIPVPDAEVHGALRALLERGVLVSEPATPPD